MNRRGFASAISALVAAAGCRGLSPVAGAAEPATPRKLTVLKVPDDCPCRLFDATGKEIKYATYAEVETGVVEQLIVDANGKAVLGLDGEVIRFRTNYPAPLTYIRGRGCDLSEVARCYRVPRHMIGDSQG